MSFYPHSPIAEETTFQATGLEAVARAILDADCIFFGAGPAPVARAMLTLVGEALQEKCVQPIATDESRSAFSLASGASLGGELSVVMINSAGFRLCAENLDLALRHELRMVIIVVQGAVQGDVQFVRWASVGGYPMIVLSPDSAQACYTLTRQAFQIAEHFCMPVVILTDNETLARQELIECHDPRPLLFALTRVSSPARGSPYSRHVATKLDPYREGLEDVQLDQPEQRNADTLVIAFGATTAAARAAVSEARANGKAVSFLVIRSLWPAPKLAIRQAATHVQRVLVVELNFGQYRREVERLLGPHGPEVVGIHRMDGDLIEVDRIVDDCL